MPLAAELRTLESSQRNTGGIRCRIATILDSLPPEDAHELNRLIDQTDVFATEIARILQQHGMKVTSGNIQHHRRRVRQAGCACPLPTGSSRESATPQEDGVTS